MGEPWHPTQLGNHSRQNKAKAKDGLLTTDKWLLMDTTRTPDTRGVSIAHYYTVGKWLAIGLDLEEQQ